MEFDHSVGNRQSIRLQSHDYAAAGAYFVTICTQHRRCLLGHIADDMMQLNYIGTMVASVWRGLPAGFPHLTLDAFVVMPNHLHGILILSDAAGKKDTCGVRANTRFALTINTQRHPRRGEPCVRPKGTLHDSLGRIIQAFKSITTNQFGRGVVQLGWQPFQGKLWQRNYWEHVIRDEEELNHIREYVDNNPAKWEFDQLNAVGNKG